MRLLIIGPPGAGKGTQAALLAEHYRIRHLSSGELLRREVAAGTEVGRAAAAYLRRGDLVPDEVVLEMLTPAIAEAARAGGYVLDGFPRTLRQAEAAWSLAQHETGMELQAVIHLVVRPAELRRRLLARAASEHRGDDTEETVAHRLDVFDRQTEPLLGFYAARGLLVDIDGEQPVASVFADVVAAVDRLARRPA